ncbi:hypothetical protein GIB67_001557 [Kingdonia uniflora]|uniref:BRCT domain-containing protein n=1 Tax=Kingdonia uniflora TaxID=39325 RepID=A0A7J7L710_9MAGN|nr:hypothetical protein GIB67_001557 [Kingdonia uniflora]
MASGNSPSSIAPGLPPAIDLPLSGIELFPMAHIPVTTDDDSFVSHSDDDKPIVIQKEKRNKRKLFDGYTFYFTADFLPWYKKFLQDLVATAGGFVLDKPLLNFSSPTKHILIYSLRCDSDDKFSCDSCCKSRNKAEALTSSRSQNKMASYTWILDSIVAGKLQAFIN